MLQPNTIAQVDADDGSDTMGRVTRINVDVPADLHRRAKSAAALRGLSMRDYMIAVLEGREPPPGPAGGEQRAHRGRPADSQDSPD